MLKRLLTVAALLLAAIPAHAGTLESVRQKGFVACGVNAGLGGFSMPDSKGAGSSLKLERWPNAPWSKGGLMHAIPFR